jgi:hypothetical protein
MVSDKQRRALVRPLIKRRPDLAYHRQYVFFRDLRHYLRGVFFESGTYGGFDLRAFVFPLFDATTFHYVRQTGSLDDEDRDEPFVKYYPTDKTGPDHLASEQMALEISDVIEREALPEVADLASPEALAKRPAYSKAGIDDILGACFNGDHEKAQLGVDSYLEFWNGSLSYKDKEVFSIDLATEEHKLDRSSEWRMAYLGKILRTDRSRIPALLHEWEAFTVKSFNLHKYWTPTPFPCEARG